jgi:GNAT superfamily N-acetyltransferase
VGKAYRVIPLRPDDASRTFPLIEPVICGLTLDQWRAYCSELERSTERRAFVAADPVGYARGLFIARRPREKDGIDTLDVPVFVVASAADAAGVTSALMDRLRAVARSDGLASLRISTGESQDFQGLAEAGSPLDDTNSTVIAI